MKTTKVHLLKKFYSNKTGIVASGGEDFVQVENIVFDEGLEGIEIRNIISNGLELHEKVKTYYVGWECSRSELDCKKVYVAGERKFVLSKLCKRFVIAPSGTVYGIGKKDIVIDPSLIVDGRYTGESGWTW